VSEYVYNADGTFAGIVRQERQLYRLENGNVRVWQLPTPGPELAGHPMGAFVGERVFELKVEGRARRYLGPEVIGTGLAWGEGAMTGRGVWPNFGHNFTSFSVMPNAEKQVTGGKFFNAGEMVANIIGVAIPDDSWGGLHGRPIWPEFGGREWPGEVCEVWQGTRTIVGGDGTVRDEIPCERRYQRAGWQDDSGSGLTLEGRAASGSITGIFKRFGWALEIEAVAAPEQAVAVLEILAGEDLVGVWQWRVDDALQKIEVIRMKPKWK
jgi:hypothetical protein